MIDRVFKTLTEQVVTVELKNDLCIMGTLKSVDQYVYVWSRFLPLGTRRLRPRMLWYGQVLEHPTGQYQSIRSY